MGKCNQHHKKYHFSPTGMYITKNTDSRVDKNIEKVKHSHTAAGNITWASCFRNSLAVPQKVKIGIIWPSNSTTRYLPKRNENICSHKNLHMNIHSNTTHNSQIRKQPKCPSTHEWTNKMWCIYRMEYYSAIKRNEVLLHATTEMNPTNIMLRERSQIHRTIFAKNFTCMNCAG